MAENMAENRPERSGAEPSPAGRAGDAGGAVPRARAPEAGETSPPRKRAKKAAKTAKAAKATEATKAAKSTKAAKATKSTKAAKSGEPERPTRKAAAKPVKASKRAAKKAPRQAPGKAPQQAPAEPEPTPETLTAVPAAPGAWMAAAWEAVREPDRPPQRLGELAVAEIGPRAAAWADWLRRTYPGAPADGIARLATRHGGRTARAVTLTGVGGPITAAFTMPATAWVRATVVLRIAAAYGHDPTAPERVPELLELVGLTPAGKPPDEPEKPEEPEEPEGPRGRGARVEAYLRRLDWLRPRLMIPSPRRPLSVLALLAGVTEEGHASERLAHRAVRFYRPGSQSSTPASARSSSSP